MFYWRLNKFWITPWTRDVKYILFPGCTFGLPMIWLIHLVNEMWIKRTLPTWGKAAGRLKVARPEAATEGLLSLREKCPNTEFFLVLIFPRSDWIRRDTKYLSVLSPNVGKYGSEKILYLDTFHAVYKKRCL